MTTEIPGPYAVRCMGDTLDEEDREFGPPSCGLVYLSREGHFGYNHQIS